MEYGSGSDVHRILIDGGLGSKYDAGLGAHLGASAGEPQFDIVIVTHVDRDHIDGVIHALRGQHLQTADIWFNGRDEIDALVNGDTRGVRQGDELSVLIPADRRNRVVDGQAIHVPPTGPVQFELPGGARCTLLSPSRKRLEKLFDKWPDPLRVVDDPTEDLLKKLDDPLTRGVGEFGEDSSVANGSSIAVLFEVGGASLLLTGDAFASDLEATIGQLLAHAASRSCASICSSCPTMGAGQNMTDGLLRADRPWCRPGLHRRLQVPPSRRGRSRRRSVRTTPTCRSTSPTTPITSASAPPRSARSRRWCHRCSSTSGPERTN